MLEIRDPFFLFRCLFGFFGELSLALGQGTTKTFNFLLQTLRAIRLARASYLGTRYTVRR